MNRPPTKWVGILVQELDAPLPPRDWTVDLPGRLLVHGRLREPR